jgi:hypothetical protein
MKRAIRTLGIIAALLVVAAIKPAAQAGALKADILKDWTGMKDTMVKIANEMPEDKYSYKSTPAQRDFAEQINHITQANLGLLGMVGPKTPAPKIDTKGTKKADVIKAMADSFDYGTAVINEQTDQSLLEVVDAKFLGRATRAKVFYDIIGHTWDIYGQMVVYLRLNGKVPPASQRP